MDSPAGRTAAAGPPARRIGVELFVRSGSEGSAADFQERLSVGNGLPARRSVPLAMLESREALDEFIARWEAGTLPKVQWTHAAHVAVGTYYAVCYPDC